MSRYFTVLAFTLFSFTVFACGEEAEEELTNTVNCAKICGKYDECVAEIDVSACTDRCENNADANEAYSRQASQCDSCTDGACAEIQGCWTSCPVVPAQD
jgi:hypothetical protein